MSTEAGYIRFQRVMVDFSADYLNPAFEAYKQKEELHRPTDKAFATVFYGFAEIASALDALTLSEVLIGLAPPRSQRIRKDEYLKYLINAYLQEVYILEQRLTTYAKKIFRMYKRTTTENTANTSTLLTDVAGTLEGIRKTRGSHVHERRYTDEKLDILSGLALMSQFKTEFAFDAHFEFRLVQREWDNTIKVNNRATHKLLDHYFDVIYPLVSREDKIFLPRTGREPAVHGHRA